MKLVDKIRALFKRKPKRKELPSKPGAKRRKVRMPSGKVYYYPKKKERG